MPVTQMHPQNSGMQRSVSKGVIFVAIAVLAVALGAALFYTLNGGFKTTAMKQDDWLHRGLPLKMARKGDMSYLEEENKQRKAKGQPLLAPPKETRDLSPEAFQKSQELLKNALQNKQPAGQ